MTWQELLTKLQRLFTSRKFWALVGSLATIWITYFTVPGALTLLDAVNGTVLAFSAYAVGTGLDDSGKLPQAP